MSDKSWLRKRAEEAAEKVANMSCAEDGTSSVSTIAVVDAIEEVAREFGKRVWSKCDQIYPVEDVLAAADSLDDPNDKGAP